MVLLINNSEFDFIASDNPIVLFNSYFNKVQDRGVIGLQSPGLQIFFALNNKLALLLYDVKCYSTGERRHQEDFSTISVNSIDDIDSINSLQILNCDENVFFSNKE